MLIAYFLCVGFGLVEAGNVNAKNELNAIFKNVVDMLFGGLVFVAIGFGLAFGEDEGANAFNGVGFWALTGIPIDDPSEAGRIYVAITFQVRLSLNVYQSRVIHADVTGSERHNVTALLTISSYPLPPRPRPSCLGVLLRESSSQATSSLP